MKNIFFNSLTIFLFVVIIYSGCKDSVSVEDIDNRPIPETNVSYSEHLQPIFDLKCSNAGCHNDQSRAAGISLSSWVQTTSDLSVVFPGQPQNSRLVWSIDPAGGIPSMPPIGYPPLTLKQINGIKKWIEEGAKNN